MVAITTISTRPIPSGRVPATSRTERLVPATSRTQRPSRPQQPSRARRAAGRYQLVAMFAGLLTVCAVWAQTGVTDRTGGGPLTVPGSGPTRTVDARQWVVQPGDTLWGIARQLQPTGDVRPLVDALSAKLGGRPLAIGQRISLP